jgi:hypothetical protein
MGCCIDDQYFFPFESGKVDGSAIKGCYFKFMNGRYFLGLHRRKDNSEEKNENKLTHINGLK